MLHVTNALWVRVNTTLVFSSGDVYDSGSYEPTKCIIYDDEPKTAINTWVTES